MMEYRTPGVSIQHILTEPARVLRTGVPVFLGLVSEAAVKAWNDDQTESNEKFLPKPLGDDPGPSIIRKKGYLRLPSRAVDGATELQISDRSSNNTTMHLRYVPLQKGSESDAAKVRSSLGAAGPALGPQAPDDDLAKLISSKPQRYTVWPQ